METFRQGLEAMDTDGVTRHLRTLEGTCMESELLRIAFPDMRIAWAEPLELFRRHFLLFHHLHRLGDRFRAEGFHLHIHFMRTGRFRLPPAGACRFFDEAAPAFCGRRTDPDAAYCARHRGPLSDGALETLSLRHFYLDPANYESLDRRTAEAFLDGAWELLANYARYRESLDALGISGTPDMAQVRRRFRRLAMDHHPDRGAESAERFHAVNRAYRFLSRVIPDFPPGKSD